MILDIGNGIARLEIIGSNANDKATLLIIGHRQAYDIVVGIVFFLSLCLLPVVVAQVGECERLFVGLDGLAIYGTLEFEFCAWLQN